MIYPPRKMLSRENLAILWPSHVNMSEKWLQKLFSYKQHIFHTNIVRSKCLFRFFHTNNTCMSSNMCQNRGRSKTLRLHVQTNDETLIEIQVYFMWEFLSTKYFLFHLLKYLSVFLFTAKWKSFPVTLCSNIDIKSRHLHCVSHFSPEYIFLLTKKICKISSQRA